MDWLDLLAVQGTLKSLLQQFKSINSSVLSFLYSPRHPYTPRPEQPLGRGSALSRLGAELELRRSGSSLGSCGGGGASKEHPGLISFRMDWLHLLAVQGTLKLGWTGWISLQSKGLSRVFSNSSKASILWHSAFFIVQLSHPYMTTGKTI